MKSASPNARDTNMLVFFALGNTKVLSFALGNAKLSDASSFASQWNIGLREQSTPEILENEQIGDVHLNGSYKSQAE